MAIQKIVYFIEKGADLKFANDIQLEKKTI